MLRGVIPILQTPFDAEGRLDLDSLRREVVHVCDARADGLCFPGFASEWWKLSGEEILLAARTIREASTIPIVFNVTSQSTYLAVEQALAFREIGCDAMMVLPPFVVPASAEAVVTHLSAVMDAVALPQILQYSPSLTGVRISIETLKQLEEKYPQFCTIKVDYIPPGPMTSLLVAAFPPGQLTYLVGYSGLQLPDFIARGGHGMMSGAGHVREDMQAFYGLLQDPREGLEKFNRLLPLLNLEMQTIDLSIAVHKLLLKDQGVISSDHVRAPGAGLDEFQTRAARMLWRQSQTAPKDY
jgi:dihydrodipicolinate synthase/N-acetylneuraminate lyase